MRRAASFHANFSPRPEACHVNQAPELGPACITPRKPLTYTTNVWQPNGNYVAHHSLGLVGYNTLLHSALIYPWPIKADRERKGATLNLKHSEGLKWHYLVE
jgi:hypothetical protein